MDKTNKPQYTGTWIPAHVMEDPELSPTDKLVYANIGCFAVCIASNQWLAERVGISVRSIQTSINKLIDVGYLNKTEVEGRRKMTAIHNFTPVSANSAGGGANSARASANSAYINKRERKEEKPTANADLFVQLVENLGFLPNKIKFSDGRRKKLAARLKNFSPEDLSLAATNLAKSPFHRGENPQGVRYGTIDFLLRNDEKVDEWRNKEVRPNYSSSNGTVGTL